MATIAELKNVNTREIREKVWRYIIDCTVEHGYVEDKDVAQHIADRFHSEHCHPNEMKAIMNDHERITVWLQGLALMTDYTYHDIMSKYAEWHECEVSDFSDKQWEKLCEDWWKFLGLKLLQMFRHYRVTEHWKTKEWKTKLYES